MEDNRKTKKQLIEELNALRHEQIEQTSVTSEKLTKAFLQNSIPTVISTAKEGRVVDVSNTFLRLVGLKRDEIIGHTSRELGYLTEEQRASFVNELNKSGHIEDFEMEIKTKSGALRYGLFNTVMMSINNENYLLTTIQDITERKLALHDLQVHQVELTTQNEELRRAQIEVEALRVRYFDLYDLAPIGYVTVSGQGLILEANLTASTMLGVPKGKLMKQIFSRYILKEDAGIYYLHRKQLFEVHSTDSTGSPQAGNSQACELRMLCQDDGTTFWARLEASAAKDTDGAHVCRIVMSDITESKRAELQKETALVALKKEEEKYRNILESIEEGYYEVDLAGNFTFFNDSMCRIIGYSKEEMMGMNNRQYTDKDHLKTLFTIFNEVYRIGRSNKEFDWQIIRKDGTKRYLELSVSLQNNSAGKPIGFQGICRDITDRKKAEEETHRGNMLLNAIIENIPNTIFLKEAKELRFTMLNRAGEDLTGYSRDDLQGKNDYDFVPKEQADFFTEKDRNVLSGKTVVDIPEEPLQTRYKGQRTLHTKKVPIMNENGEPEYLLGISEDITERKQIEEDKKKLETQTRQLQKSESLGRMAAAIAHHFNNQLGVVMGNLEMAIDELPQDAGPINKLNSAMQATGKAAQMSGLMLTFLGQSSDKREPLDIAEACLRNKPVIRAVMPGNVVMENNLPSPGPVINANANQMQQVLTNLLTNAREAIGDKKGTISLNVKTVSPEEISALHRFPSDWQPKDKVYACVEVKDTGCGIKDEDIEKLFDPFYTSKFTGRGMGLPVVLGIVKAHGGMITMESKVGSGSIFRVFFPVSAEEVPRRSDKAFLPLAIEEGGTVLLVEDEEQLRIMVATMLKRLGFSVIEAKDGVEAVELFLQHQDEIKFVISDLTMPRMDGWEALTALRKIKPGVPVILASGYDKAHVMAGDHPELPQAFLGKPYRLKELSDAISHALHLWT